MRRTLEECWRLIEEAEVKHKAEIEKYPISIFENELSSCKLDGRQAGYYWLSLAMWNNNLMGASSYASWEIGVRDMRSPNSFRIVFIGPSRIAHHKFSVLDKWYRRQWLRDMQATL